MMTNTAGDSKNITYPLNFNGKTYNVKPGNVAIFTIKTNEVDLATATKAVGKINKKLIKRGIFGIFLPDFINFERFESFDDVLNDIEKAMRLQVLEEAEKQIKEKKKEFEETGELKWGKGES